jgi:site-specific recombinase XerC
VPAPPEPPPSVAGAADVLLKRFGDYLAGQRALTAPVVQAYQRWVRPFTEAVLLCRGGVDRSRELTAADVSRSLAGHLPGLSRKSAQMTACARRSLLRFLHAEQMVPAGPGGVVPPVASWRLSGLPKALTPGQVQEPPSLSVSPARDSGGSPDRRDVRTLLSGT